MLPDSAHVSDSAALSADAPLRKHPTQARALRTLEILFEAATRILEREGESGLTTNRIAERAGYSIGTLYQYFPSKEAIVVALVRRRRERVLRELYALLDEDGAGTCTPQQVLDLYVRRLIEAFAHGQQAQRVLMRLGWQLDAQALITRTMDEAGVRIAAALRRRADPAWPEPSPVRLYLLTRAVMGAIRSASIEDSPLLTDPAFEVELVRMAGQMLRADDDPRG